MEVHNAFFKNVMRYRDFLKSVIALWTRPIRRYALLVFFRPALWRYGVLFSRKRYGVMGALKKAFWRYGGPPPLKETSFSLEIAFFSLESVMAL